MALCALSPSLATASSRVCVKKEERAALPSQKPRRSRKREKREKREGCEGAMTIDDEFDVFFSRSTCPLSQKSEREAVPMPLDDGTDAGAGGGAIAITPSPSLPVLFADAAETKATVTIFEAGTGAAAAKGSRVDVVEPRRAMELAAAVGAPPPPSPRAKPPQGTCLSESAC